MKRVMLAVLGLFCAVSLCMAQNWQTRVQRGIATQEMQAAGLSAAHSGIPVGSKVKITNPANGLEIEATIVNQIPESYNRIIDLSPSAAMALGLGSGGPVLVTSLSLPPTATVTPPPPAPVPPIPAASEPKVQVEVESEAETAQIPFNLIINNYIVNPEKPESEEKKPEEFYAITSKDEVIPEPAPLPPPLPPPPPPPPAAPAPVITAPPVYPSLFSAPPVPNIQITPGVPNPNTDKIYRLLVGTYQGLDNAFVISQQLQAAGFDVSQEQAGDMCRVYAANVPASRVYYACQRLGAIGFQQVWINE